MKKAFKFLAILAITASVFTSCEKDNDGINTPIKPSKSYILNYGSYSGDKSTITAIDIDSSFVATDIYENVNDVPMISNVQHACNFNNKIYFMGNNADQVFWVNDTSFKQTENGITAGIIKPRYGVGSGNYLYVSCWGGDIWKDENTSYIAKINVTTKVVEKKIALPGGPEGLAIVKNKLYAALNYKDSVAIVDLSTEAISYIATPAVTSYFIADNHDNLYVSLVSTFSDFTTNDGIGYINTTSNSLDTTYAISGVSNSYVNILAMNSDYSKLYVMTSAYDANWKLSGAVATFDIASKSFESKKLIEGIDALNGIGVYNEKVLCFVSPSVTANGKVKTYSATGTFLQEYETGIAPLMLFSVK